MIRRAKLLTLVAAVVAMFAMMLPASAQTTLVYGSGATGTFSAQAPLAFYAFQGQANDLVSILVLGLTPGMQPSISLNSPTQQQLANSAVDPFGVGSSSARLSAQLPSDGIYTVIVAASNGVVGDYAIRLDGSPMSAESTVDPDTTTSSPIVAAGNTVFNIVGNPDNSQVATLSTVTPQFSFSALLQNEAGATLAVFSGSDVQPAFITLPASNGTFKIIVNSTTGTDGEVSLSLGTGPSAPSSDVSTPDSSGDNTVVEPEVTEEVTPEDSSSSSEESTSDSSSSPTPTQQPGVSSTATFTPTAQQQQQVNATATYTPTAQQQQQVNPTATYTPSYTPTTQQQVNPTATYTPSYTPTTQAPTATYTPSYTPTTPPAPQEAPEDQRSYAFNMQLDTTSSITEFVSYPGGDVEDRVVYDVRGMNPNVAFSGGRARLIVAVSCFGTNTDQVQFFTNGQTYTCGQTIIDKEVTFDSNNGSVVITAIGGNGTYVQWVLTGTVTRIN